MQRVPFLINLPKVERGLMSKPRFCTLAERNLKPHRHFRADGSAAIDDFRQGFAGYVEAFGSARYRQFQWFKPEFGKNFAGVRRVMHTHGVPHSVVVHVIDNVNIAILESKNDSPVRLNCHSPDSGQIAFQRMQPQRWRVDIVNFGCIAQQSQNEAKALAVDRLNPRLTARREKTLKPLVCERFDHL
jgi:hypothetical protein